MNISVPSEWKVNTHTHPEQWAAIYTAVPGEQLGVRCLAQGHLSRGIEGGERALYIHSPTYNSCRTWDSNPQPLDYKSDSLTIRPRLPQTMWDIDWKRLDMIHSYTFTCGLTKKKKLNKLKPYNVIVK